MNSLKLFLLIFIAFILTGCGELFDCSNPSKVALLERLPCSNCEFKGLVKPNICPTGTYSHKLQCMAAKKGANVVLLNKVDNSVEPSFAAYSCPVPTRRTVTCNVNTDVSNNCCVAVGRGIIR